MPFSGSGGVFTGTENGDLASIFPAVLSVPGPYTFFGLGGVDTLDFGIELRNHFTIVRLDATTIQVDALSEASGAFHATLHDIERIKFLDQTLDLTTFALNNAPTGSVTISGTATQGQTLTASNTLADLDGLGAISYQWKANGVAIGGATGSALLLAEAQVGKTITVTASYTDGHGTAEAVTSDPTGAVANVNDAPTGGVTITGTATQGQVLNANSTLADLDGLGPLNIQWLRDGAVIGAATASAYTLTQNDVGAAISVSVSYTDGFGHAESVTSGATGAVANINDAPSGGVSIAATATQGQLLSANAATLADLDGLGFLSYQWLRSGADIVGATAGTYTPVQGDVGSTISVRVSYTDGFGHAESVTSNVTGAVANVNDPPSGGVSITGTATQGQVLAIDVSTLADLDGLGALNYQWLRGGTVIVGATASGYTLVQGDVGTAISVRASYTDGGGAAESVTSAATSAVANVNDAPAGGVSIDGTAEQDQVLTANAATLADLDGLGALAYQWLRVGADVAGANASTYLLGDADIGSAISVRVSYTDGGGTAESVTSGSTGAVLRVNHLPTGTVSVTGTPAQGQALSAETSTLADTDGLGTLGYQWLRAGAVIAGATASNYTLTQGDVGNAISVRVSYTDGFAHDESVTSATTAAVSNVNDAPTGTVSISGSAVQAQILTANIAALADLDGLGAFNYQWLRGGVGIGGATAGTYTLTQNDVGAAISVRVSYIDGGLTLESVTSGATGAVANINDAPTGGVSVIGVVTQGQVLSANTAALADADGLGAFAYQWLRAGAVVAGATANTYSLTQADVGAAMSVRVSYTDGFGAAESVTSAPTAAVANVNDAPTGNVSVTGTPTQGQVLSAVTATLADLDGLGAFSYQWLHNGAVVAGATAGTYTLAQGDVGTAVSVRVSYTDGGGTVESVTSSPTGLVANVNDAPTGNVSITGTVTQGQVLSANTATLADLDGLGALSYQWLHSGAAIAGATASSYTPTQNDVGTAISVRVNYTDGGGTAESVTSGSTAAVANANDAPTGGVSITGTPTQGQVLTAVTTALADLDGLGAFSTQWLHGGAVIAGATATTYTLALSDVGTAVSVRVNYTDGFGTAESVTSTATAAVAHNSGVDPAQEALVPPPNAGGLTGDGNGDGILDSTEANVTSAPVALHGSANPTYLTLISDSLHGVTDTGDNNSSSISNFQVLSGPVVKPGILTLPTDVIEFDANLSQAGGTETFSLFIDGGVAVDGFWHQNNAGMWVNLATATAVVGNKVRVDFTVTDGGPNDADGLANGVIVVVGGEGFMPLSVLGAAPDNPAHSFWI